MSVVQSSLSSSSSDAGGVTRRQFSASGQNVRRSMSDGGGAQRTLSGGRVDDARVWFKPLGDFHEALTKPHGTFDVQLVRVLPVRGTALRALLHPMVAVCAMVLWFVLLFCASLRMLPASPALLAATCVFAALALAAQMSITDRSLLLRLLTYFEFPFVAFMSSLAGALESSIVHVSHSFRGHYSHSVSHSPTLGATASMSIWQEVNEPWAAGANAATIAASVLPRVFWLQTMLALASLDAAVLFTSRPLRLAALVVMLAHNLTLLLCNTYVWRATAHPIEFFFLYRSDSAYVGACIVANNNSDTK